MSAKPAANSARLVEKARDPDASLHEQHAAFTLLVQRSQHIVFGLALAACASFAIQRHSRRG